MNSEDDRSSAAADPAADSRGAPEANSAQALRRRAEALAADRAGEMPENRETLSPDEVRRVLHDLRVHQIELEMQNVELRRTQDELEVSRARYFDLYNLAPVGYFTLSERGLILEANLTGARLLGVARGALIEQPLSRFIVPEDQDIHYRHFKLLLETGRPQSWELRLLRKDAAPFWARVEATGAQDADGASVCRAAVSDITERKQAEEEVRRLNEELEHRVQLRTAQLEASNKELDAFSYSVSHDLRAPLRAMDGFSRMLVEEYRPQLPAEAQKYLDFARRSAIRMGELIDGLLALSHLGRQELKRRPVAVSDIVRQSIDDLHADCEGREVEFVVGALPACEADRLLLRQVFANLLSNGVKYTRKREKARIEVGALKFGQVSRPGESDQAGGAIPPALDPECWVYYVRDNGAGFDMRYAKNLFGVFQRLHPVTEFEGTGVGLATVQRIIHKHGGEVWAEAAADKGATFYFTIGA